jgi:chemotaxis protein CheX
MNPMQHDFDQKDLCVFIDALTHYFRQLTREDADVLPSYLSLHEIPAQEYTGLIRISGQYHGQVYFSAPSALLRHLMLAQGEAQLTEANLLDQVGEIANTLAGNARSYFGERFIISVPQTLRGEPQTAIAARPFVIPLNWKKYNALLVVDVCSGTAPS